MPRKEIKERRPDPSPDILHHSVLVAKLINKVMRHGKKTVAEGIVYDALGLVQKRLNENPAEVLARAVENVRPLLEVKPRRVGGATYQVPVEVRPLRGVTLALRWLIGFAGSRTGEPMDERLAKELLDAAKGEGAAMKKREDTHKMAEANKAFAHYRW